MMAWAWLEPGEINGDLDYGIELKYTLVIKLAGGGDWMQKVNGREWPLFFGLNDWVLMIPPTFTVYLLFQPSFSIPDIFPIVSFIWLPQHSPCSSLSNAPRLGLFPFPCTSTYNWSPTPSTCTCESLPLFPSPLPYVSLDYYKIS